MPKSNDTPTVTIDGKAYPLDTLSDTAKAQLASLQNVNLRIQDIQQEMAILQTARIAYANALKGELK
jgi:hypothetical protein